MNYSSIDDAAIRILDDPAMNAALKHNLAFSGQTAVVGAVLAAAIIAALTGQIDEAAAASAAAAIVLGASAFVVTAFAASWRRTGPAPLGRALVGGAGLGAIAAVITWYAGWRPADTLPLHVAAGTIFWSLAAAYLQAAKRLHN